MTLTYSDERDLLLPLYGGIGETPLWQTFMRRLLERTRARRVGLLIRLAGPARPVLLQSTVAAQGIEADTGDQPTDAGLLQIASLRPNRVYSLDELLIRDDGRAARAQREALDRAEIAYARLIRVPAAGDLDGWLSLMHDRSDFSAADSALLSSVAPHFALALNMLADADRCRLRTAMAEEALQLVGIGQAAFDAEGRVIAADPAAAAELDVQATGRPQLRPREIHALSSACGELAGEPPQARRVVRIEEWAGKGMLLRPAPPSTTRLPCGAVAIGLVRQPRRENEASAARVIAAAYGLSAREAALAEAMSQGRSIAKAGAELQLTQQTARNYSKRVYAKTGTTGQADLVRLLLTGLAPFS